MIFVVWKDKILILIICYSRSRSYWCMWLVLHNLFVLKGLFASEDMEGKITCDIVYSLVYVDCKIWTQGHGFWPISNLVPATNANWYLYELPFIKPLAGLNYIFISFNYGVPLWLSLNKCLYFIMIEYVLVFIIIPLKQHF